MTLAKLTGTTLNTIGRTISSSGNTMQIVWDPPGWQNEKGTFSFQIHYTPLKMQCQEWLDHHLGWLKSPDKLSDMGNNVTCHWVVTVSNIYSLTLEMISYDLQIGSEYLAIYHGGSNQSELLKNLTGVLQQSIHVSTPENQLFVLFQTNQVRSMTEFSMKIHKIDKCQYWLDLENHQLTSPNYPKSYDHYMLCKWHISTEEHFYITLNFQEFEVRILSFYCT